MERTARHPAAGHRPLDASFALVGALGLVLAGLYAGWLASRGSFGREALALVLLGVTAFALSASPNTFLALALLVMGTESVSEAHPFAFGGAQIYSVDVLLGIVLLRAVLPRDRERAPAKLGELTTFLFAIWGLIIVAAGVRSALDGYRLVSIVRLATPLFYAGGLYVGFGRIIRERGFSIDKAVRNLLVVALALVAYMVAARAANTPFENETNPAIGHLGTVITTSGTLRRDFGFGSAFILYPALGIGGVAYLFNNPRRTGLAAAVAGVGIIATFLTLIRGEIFGLVLGLAVIVLLRTPATPARLTRATAVVAGSLALAVGALALWVASPTTARGIVERSLPGIVPQTAAANENAQFRKDAVRAGVAAAQRHPAGVGLVPDEAVTSRSGVDLGFIAHSGFTAMAVYTGWVGSIAAALLLLSLLRDSFSLPRPLPWLHPFFVGSLLMIVFYTVFDAAGLIGQSWVTALAALITALRFNAADSA